MITIVIIDDEINNANYLKALIEENFKGIRLLGIATSVSEGVALIRHVKPSLVFLDVELHNATGFDLLDQLGKIDFSVIFTTAHERYALKAIKFAALDYLLKPVDISDLETAVQKVTKDIRQNTADKSMDLFLETMRKQNEQKKIAISTAASIIVMEIKDIIYMQADGPYTHIYAHNSEKIMSSKHLKEYEELLTDFGFFRCHRSFFVNLAEIKQYAKSDGGFVVMSNGDRVDVSDKKKAELLGKLSSQVLFPK